MTALDTFGNVLWEIESGKQGCCYLFFEDLDCDGTQEIYSLLSMVSSLDEKKFDKIGYEIACFDERGNTVWSHQFQTTPHWREPQPHFIFSDIGNDGYKEILTANYVLDRNGTILHDYDTDSLITAAVDIDNDSQIELLLEKSHMSYGETPFVTFYYTLIEVDGHILWEKESTEFINLLLLEDEKELFLLYRDRISQVDPVTFEETVVAEVDFHHSIYMSPGLFQADFDNDGESEYIIITENIGDFDNTILVYDKNFNLIWTYSAPVKSVSLFDLEEDGRPEFLVLQRLSLDIIGLPLYFSVLDYEGEKWNIRFDTVADEPYLLDIDADGDTELVFEVSFRAKEVGMPSECEYFYIFDDKGNLEKQIMVPPSSEDYFHDIDGDGDKDVLFESEGGISVYANTRYCGPLDELCNGVPVEVDLGEKGFERNVQIDLDRHYGLEKLKRLQDPYYVLVFFSENLEFPGIFLILSLLVSFFITRTLKKKEFNWEPVGGFKKIAALLLLVFVSPVALAYFLFKAWEKEYREALGFPITKKQLLSSGALGLIFLFSTMNYGLFLFASGVEPPSTDVGFVRDFPLIAVLFIVITAPIVEEIVFSGYLYPLLRKKIGVVLGITTTALLFASIHLELILIPIFFVQAAIKTYAYERTHCISVPVIIHFVNNFFVVAVALL